MSNLNFNSYDTLDDMLHAVFEDLLALPFNLRNSRGVTSELVGVSLNLTNPRARLSRSEIKAKAFSAIGELLWYLAGSNELKFIEHYISAYKKETDDGNTIYGAYGPRIFNMRDQFNQIDNVTKLLTDNPSTRKAVIQLFDAMDLQDKHKEIPCTCTLQFLIRENKLNLYVSMRSNDAFKGLPHDVFAFTMLQEIMSVKLSVDLGSYYHSVGSLHLYKRDETKAKQYLNEGFQPTNLNMAPMPPGNPWPAIKWLLDFESNSRNHGLVEIDPEQDEFWCNLAKMLLIYNLYKKRSSNKKIREIMEGMDPIYQVYIEPKIKEATK
jgi:thymidylate synthase